MKSRILPLLLLCSLLNAQPYLKENGKTRHRFAQSVFGLDLQSSSGGNASQTTSSGATDRFSLKASASPRVYISGVHFWGHAEFYFSFQLINSRSQREDVKTTFNRADIFGAKIYPWPIRKKSIRPFAGISLSSQYFQQSSQNGKGGKAYKAVFPMTAGFNYCTESYLIEASFVYNPLSEINYYISEAKKVAVTTPPYFISVGIRKWLETTVASEKNYMNGEIEKRYNYFRSQKKLSSWFIGAGPSSAFYLNESSFNSEQFPYTEKPFSVIFPEVSGGYFFEQLKIHVGLAFRHHQKKTKAYSVDQKYTRTSASAEAFFYLFDYHGFNPYLGITGSADRLNFQHEQNGEKKINQTSELLSSGIIAGWDILPDKLQGFILRTNLRYFPLRMKENNSRKTIDFSQVEFNFIQLIVYPQRIRRFKEK